MKDIIIIGLSLACLALAAYAADKQNGIAEVSDQYSQLMKITNDHWGETTNQQDMELFKLRSAYNGCIREYDELAAKGVVDLSKSTP